VGEPGVGKDAALRHLVQNANRHRYQVIYLSETDFGRLDLYRSLALALGIDPPPSARGAVARVESAHPGPGDNKQLLPVWAIDEAQNLPPEFFRDFRRS